MAAPSVNPTMTLCETNRVRSPSRKNAMPSCTAPTRNASAIAAGMRSLLGNHRQRAEQGDGDGVGRAVDEQPGRVEQRPDGGHHDGGVQTVLRRQAREHRVGHRLRNGDRRHRQPGREVAPPMTRTYSRGGIERGYPSRQPAHGRCGTIQIRWGSSCLGHDQRFSGQALCRPRDRPRGFL